MRNRIVGLDLAIADQLHNAGGGGDYLGQRGHVEDRLGSHPFPPGFKRAIPEGLAVNHLAIVPYQNNRTGNVSPLDCVFDDGINDGQPLARSCLRRPRRWISKSGKVERQHGYEDTNAQASKMLAHSVVDFGKDALNLYKRPRNSK
jgi:hypothetical protein